MPGRPIGYLMTPEMYAAVQDTGRDVRRNRATRKARRPEKRTVVGTEPRYAELTGNMSAASNFKTGSTTVSAKLLIRDPNNSTQLIDGETITIRNRWTDLELTSGKRVVVAWVSGEWCIIASECP